MGRQDFKVVRFLSLLLLISSLLTATTTGQPYYFRHYQVENGLSNNTVFCAAQDRHGFVWLGTKDGLDRFNGYNFKEYRFTPGAFGLGDSYIRSIFLDSTGGTDTFYVGTRIGVYKFDPIKEQFTLLLKTNGEVGSILKDQGQRLWVIAGKKLTCYNIRTHKKQVFNPRNHFQPTSVCMTAEGQIWVSTADGKLCRYDPSGGPGGEFTNYDLFADTLHQPTKWIENLFVTRQGLILAGTSNNGVKSFNPDTKQVTSLAIYNTDHTGIFARDFVQVSDTSIWIATESGIFIYQLPSGSFVNLTQQTGDPYSLSDNAVYSLCQDQEGGIWAGTHSGGVNYFPRQYNTFDKYFAGQGTQSLYGNVVREICQDKYGMLWIGTEDGGLNRLSPRTNQMEHFLARGRPTDITYPNIHGLLPLGDTLLIGTFEHGLDMMDIRSGKVFAHFPKNNKSKILRSNFMVSFCHTIDGTVYAGTRLGLYKFNPKTGVFSPVLPLLADCFIHTLMEDKDHALWIGTMGNGLYSYQPKTGLLKSYLHQADNPRSINNNWITTIYQDETGAIWAGTEGGGLCRLAAGSNKFEHYTTKDGLPSNTIYKILEDDEGFLWMSTSRGLVKFQVTTGKITVFTTANGLLSDQFNYNCGFKDAAGKLYFGSVKGLISFNPEAFRSADFIPSLCITAVQAEGKEIAGWGELVQPVGDAAFAEISVPHKQASLSLEFAALSFTAPEMTEYKYILEGLDKDWTYLKSNRKVYFTNLTPGTYTFRVKAANSSGKWNGKEAVLSIHILPTFWESTLAYTLYLLAAVLIGYIIFSSYHARIAEKNKRLVDHMAHEKEKELYEAKIDFFTHVTHEIKTPLTLIKAPLEKIMKKIDAYPGIRKYILMMQRNTSRMEDLSGQLLDFRKTEVGGFHLNYTEVNINGLLRDLLLDFKTAAADKGIHLDHKLTRTPLIASVDKEAVTKILSNLLDNAVKYAVSYVLVEMSVLSDDQQFAIAVKNDGANTGIPEDLKERLFEPFFRLDSAKSQSGAGLGLALSRSLATLQGGSLKLLETGPENITFVLRLPLNKTDPAEI